MSYTGLVAHHRPDRHVRFLRPHQGPGEKKTVMKRLRNRFSSLFSCASRRFSKTGSGQAHTKNGCYLKWPFAVLESQVETLRYEHAIYMTGDGEPQPKKLQNFKTDLCFLILGASSARVFDVRFVVGATWACLGKRGGGWPARAQLISHRQAAQQIKLSRPPATHTHKYSNF